MNENDVLFQKVTQAYSGMPVSLSGIIHHSQVASIKQSLTSIQAVMPLWTAAEFPLAVVL